MDFIDTPGRFGSLVRLRRQALGMTQRDLALAVNVGERFIVDLESGKPTCQLGKALAVAKGLGIRLTDRTAGHGPMADTAAVPSADTLPGPDDAYPDLPDLGDEA
ncbi:helix-turn-helix domain-containing protein (plasmid) [Skermanella mucosa]|uniref:helix-turn-helix domain-containing protein n=1 Tax=Skermanella mucosa TaxID=1789672 RepID=UPI00192B3474|nr:helix-turn-helix domain-containing protein [Skermanella mucosa]UEM25128.1 helix-turn-helix domain-containing protein [Skermanella mucosa]